MLLARTFAAAMVGVLLMASGCTSMNPVVRSQSPTDGQTGGIQQTGFNRLSNKNQVGTFGSRLPLPNHTRALPHPVYDATLGQIGTNQKTFHAYDGAAGHVGVHGGGVQGAGFNGSCPSCRQNGQGFNAACPSCRQGGGGVHGSSCRDGRCGRFGCKHPICIRDARSFSYKQPADLRYPMQNQLGGSVVYPYYTHKGPSDFFRQ